MGNTNRRSHSNPSVIAGTLFAFATVYTGLAIALTAILFVRQSEDRSLSMLGLVTTVYALGGLAVFLSLKSSLLWAARLAMIVFGVPSICGIAGALLALISLPLETSHGRASLMGIYILLFASLALIILNVPAFIAGLKLLKAIRQGKERH